MSAACVNFQQFSVVGTVAIMHISELVSISNIYASTPNVATAHGENQATDCAFPVDISPLEKLRFIARLLKDSFFFSLFHTAVEHAN